VFAYMDVLFSLFVGNVYHRELRLRSAACIAEGALVSANVHIGGKDGGTNMCTYQETFFVYLRKEEIVRGNFSNLLLR
jgi:hypothetical protein